MVSSTQAIQAGASRHVGRAMVARAVWLGPCPSGLP